MRQATATHQRAVCASQRPDHRAALTVLMLIAAAAPLLAHERSGQAEGFWTGLQHPVSGLDHVLAMGAVGLWGAQLGAPAVWALPVAFPMVMAVGGFLGLVGIAVPGVEIGIAASAIMLGLVVTAEARPPLAAAAALVSLFAIFHGHAHGAELPPEQNGLTYSIGFVIATGCLHAAGILMGLLHAWRAGRIAVQISGAAIAGSGVLFLWRALA